MLLRSLLLPLVTFLLTVSGAEAQITCDGQNCTFTLAFEDRHGNPNFNFAGVPYSGRQITTNSQNGRTVAILSNPMTYRDSRGRTRTERYVYRNSNASNPDDFMVIEIHDPVAQYQYILDPVTRTAHRMHYQATIQQKNGPVLASLGKPGSTTQLDGTITVFQSLDPEKISGVDAIGGRTTITGPGTPTAPGTVISTNEVWYDPQIGIPLRSVQTRIDNGLTSTGTMQNYTTVEPDPALFRVPNGYKVADETGPFRVVHSQLSESPVTFAHGGQGPSTIVKCHNTDAACTVRFEPGVDWQMPAITGAPYSAGRPLIEISPRTFANGATLPGMSRSGSAVYRDSKGRLRTDPAQAGVEILDPVSGYQIFLDIPNHIAYRVPIQFREIPFQFDASPSGSEELGERTVLGVTTVGRRTPENMSDHWIDPRTGVALLSETAGPDRNVTSTLRDYKPGEPDPALFRIPTDYRIVEETGSFEFPIAKGN